jgi:hypothetical protein
LPEAGVAIDSVMDTIAEDNWQFSLSGQGWKAVKYPDDTIKVVMVNEDLGIMIFLAKEETKQSAPDYIINTLRTFHTAGASVVSAKQITINGTSFIRVDATDDERHIFSWINVQKGFGYVFTCAVQGEADVGLISDRCDVISNTLQIQ